MTVLLAAKELAIPGRLQPVSLSVEDSGLVALIGPNGSGKSSLLRAIAGIDPSSGSATVDGEDVWMAPPARRQRLIGFLPASRDIAWPIAVRDLVTLGLPAPRPERVAELLQLLELEALADRPITGISTGERARTLFARALAARPRLLLLDEPLSNLDPYWVLRTLQILQDEVASNGSSAVVAVHDLGLIDRFDRAVLLDHGRLAADRKPDDLVMTAELSKAFRIVRTESGWRVNPSADRQSSP